MPELVCFFLITVIGAWGFAVGLAAGLGVYMQTLRRASRSVYNSVVFADAPEYWQAHFQDGATDVVLDTYEFYGDLAGVMVLVATFVAWLAFRALWQFSSGSNSQNPKLRFQHHTNLEVWWTLIPTLILLWIAAPSLTLLYATESSGIPSVTVRAIGRQWYWSYESGDVFVTYTPEHTVEEFRIVQNPLTALTDLRKWERAKGVSVFDYLNPDGTLSVERFCKIGGGFGPSFLTVYDQLWPDGPARNGWLECLEEVEGDVEALDVLVAEFVAPVLDDGTVTVSELTEEEWVWLFTELDIPMAILSEDGIVDYKIGLIRNLRHLGPALAGRQYSFCERTLRVIPEKTTAEPLLLAWDSTLAPRPRKPSPVIDGPRPSRWHSTSRSSSPRFATQPRLRSWHRYDWSSVRGVADWWSAGSPDYGTRNWLLATQQPLVLPSNRPLRLLVTATDVIHSWAVPSFGVKIDACPGRLNQVLFTILRSGTFYGQCSEICGVNHGFMPIEVRAVPAPVYEVYRAGAPRVFEALELSAKARLEQTRVFRYSWSVPEAYLTGLHHSFARKTLMV